MQESKLTYIATVLGAGALLISAAGAFFSALPAQSRISQLESQVAELTAKDVSNSARIAELDLGLAAVVKVAGIDHEQLRAAIILLRSEQIKIEVAAETQPELLTSEPEIKPEPQQDSGSDNAFAQLEADLAANLENASAPLSITAPAKPKAQPKKALKPALSIAEVDAVLGGRISEKWYKPDDADPKLTAVIKLNFDRNGALKGSEMLRASGNAPFDQSVLNAVKTIGAINEVAQLSDADYKKSYEGRTIQFTPNMGK